MSGDIKNIIQILKFAKDCIGKTKPITVDSGIFNHFNEEDSISNDEQQQEWQNDAKIIKASKTKPIDLDDIIKTFEKMHKQFDGSNKPLDDDRCYFYEGIYKDKLGNYAISWGS